MNQVVEAPKLPPVNVSFWILIITATTLGETAGDLLSQTLNVGYALSSLILIALFVVVLLFELLVARPHRALYWAVIILTSTAGTTMADYVTRSLALGYGYGTLLLVVMLAAIFVGWRATARSLALVNVRSIKAESLYWAAILVSSTLGTALGDALADESGLNLGFGGGTAVLAGLLCAIVLATFFTKASRVLLFWLAIVVTHPIGATMGDYLTKPSGFALGPVPATLGLLALFSVTAVVIGRRRV